MRVWLAAIAASLVSTATAAAPPDPATAAKAWAELVDKGLYAQSWSQAGTLFQAHVTEAKWASLVATVRGPLGPLTHRSLTSEKHATSLPGVPDGDYAVLQFASAFAHKRAAVETIALAHEPGGWRVDGYFIR